MFLTFQLEIIWNFSSAMLAFFSCTDPATASNTSSPVEHAKRCLTLILVCLFLGCFSAIVLGSNRHTGEQETVSNWSVSSVLSNQSRALLLKYLPLTFPARRYLISYVNAERPDFGPPSAYSYHPSSYLRYPSSIVVWSIFTIYVVERLDGWSPKSRTFCNP